MSTTKTSETALHAALERAVVVDRSDLTRLLATGPDMLDLLHRLSTADLATLGPGEGKPTVVTTAKGRIVERLFVHHRGPRGVLMIGGAGSQVAAHFKRYTFAENTGLSDITSETAQFVICGPRAVDVVERAGLVAPVTYATGSGTLAGCAVDILGQDGMGAAGFSVVARRDDLGAVHTALVEAASAVGGCAATPETLEVYRVRCGLPAAGHELTEEHNPLEAGLWDAVSFEKGCYVGQEVVARLRTYDKISRALVHLALPVGAGLPPVGAALRVDGRVVGKLTSAVLAAGDEAPLGLGYVKRKEIRPGLRVVVGDDDTGPLAALTPVEGHR